MLSHFSAFILKTLGWSILGRYPKELPKGILIVAPHTSNWDFPLGMLVRAAIRADIKFLGKESLFRPPHGWFFRWLGGYPVNRKKSTNYVQTMVDIFNKKERFHIVLAPEGTRGKVAKLKTGFYHIAKGAGTPIIMCKFDFPTKKVEFSEPFYPSADQQADFENINAYFKGAKGKRPELGYLYEN